MINDLKDLKALFKLCRAQGITEFKMGTIDIKFGELPRAPGSSVSEQDLSSEDPANPYANFPQGELTPDQLVFYSAGGKPEEDPYNKEAM
jgi:hypothetical protein